jgi:hypothetical protein
MIIDAIYTICANIIISLCTGGEFIVICYHYLYPARWNNVFIPVDHLYSARQQPAKR